MVRRYAVPALALLVVPAPARADTPFERAVAELGRRGGFEILVRDAPRPSERMRMVDSLPPRKALESLARAYGLAVVEIAPRRFLLARPPRSRHTRPSEPAPVDVPTPDILVQARRVSELSGDVPLSLSVIGPAILRERQVRRLDDLTGAVPGLMVTSQTSGTTPLFVLRGQRRAVGDNLRLPVVTYLAEVPLPNEGGLLPVFDLASIQVLRGPQGTLFGRNTTGGAILLAPAPPSTDFGGYAELTAGDYGLTTFEGAITGGVARDVAVRLAVQSSRRGGFVRDTLQNIDLDDVHSDAARLSVAAEPAAELSQRLVIDWLDADERGVADILRGVYPNPPAVTGGGNARAPAAVPFYDCGRPGCDVDLALAALAALGVRRTTTNVTPVARRHLFGVIAITEYGDAALRAKMILGYRATLVETRQDQDGTPLAVQESADRSDRTQYTAEVQLAGRSDAGFDWVGGVFLSDSRPAGRNGSSVVSLAAPGVGPVHFSRYEHIASWAAYGEAHIGLVPDLRLTLGGRYGRDHVMGCGTTRNAAPAISEAMCRAMGGTSGNVRSGAPSWTISLDRRFGRLLVYAATRRAYRPAGFNVPVLGPALAAYQTYRPETLTDVEVGAKADGSVAGWRLSGAAALYSGAYRDIQRALTPGINLDGDTISANDPATLVINAARARISGIESEMSVRRGDLTLNAAATFTDARYQRFDVDPMLSGLLGGDPVGNVFSYTPRWTVAAGARYRVPVAARLGEPHIGVQMRAQARMYFSGRPNDSYAIQPPYALVDLDAGWEGIGGSRLSAALFVRNLTDRRYAIGGGVVTPAITTATLIYGAPRTAGARLRLTF